jgi:hypothetical protein
MYQKEWLGMLSFKQHIQESEELLDNLEEDATEYYSASQMMAAAKELEAYAKKHGGVDKADFMKAAKMLASGKAGTNLIKFVDDLDTEPREKIITVMGTHIGNKPVGRMFGVKQNVLKRFRYNISRNEETLNEMKNTHALIDTADGNKVVAMASSEQGVKQSKASAERPPMSIKDKNTLKIVKLKKPVSQKASDKIMGRPLNEEKIKEYV